MHTVKYVGVFHSINVMILVIEPLTKHLLQELSNMWCPKINHDQNALLLHGGSKGMGVGSIISNGDIELRTISNK